MLFVFRFALTLALAIGTIAGFFTKTQMSLVQVHIELGSLIQNQNGDGYDPSKGVESLATNDRNHDGHDHDHSAGFPPHSHDSRSHLLSHLVASDIYFGHRAPLKAVFATTNRFLRPADTLDKGDLYSSELLRPPIV